VTAAYDVLKAARFVDDAGKSRVEVSAILDVLTDHPNINALDNKGFWARFGAPDAPAPSWDSVSRRLARLRRESISTADYTSELAVWERRAPADIEPTLASFGRVRTTITSARQVQLGVRVRF